MPLDFTLVAAQVEGMVDRLGRERAQQAQRLAFARETLAQQAQSLPSLKQKIAASNTTWLVAGLGQGLDGRHAPPPLPQAFAVVAVDGSHIDVDRHSPARCYLLNMGLVQLQYGAEPKAVLRSQPALYSEESDLMLSDPSSNREEPIEGALLGIRRSVEECWALASLVEGMDEAMPALALLDGSLILWGLASQRYGDFVREALLDNSFLKCLDKLKGLTSRSKRALASYISFPRSTEVVNVLRVALCPYEPADCDRFCPGRRASRGRPCDKVAGVLDSDLFLRLLEEGERSDVFLSRSSVVRERYREHEVCFFYMKVGEEIGRVEMPRWVAEDGDLLGLAHALVYDQCRRGLGYPVALSEAHEQAVVTAADRGQFQELVEQMLEERRLPCASSTKRLSKRLRWI
ncbi:MAG TPA: DNA double-strand break repair nuclease NurA [Dehalococcoidia bacterium]|jgi:hypothetical protein|nr:DNA double-strand break repair nuclease NurA [Dehalococcoidia bacterium]